MVQDVNKWKHYLMGKEIVIHIDHQLLQYLQAQSKLQQTRHYKRMGCLQQFHLVINYKKGNTKKLSNMLSRPPTSKLTTLGNFMQMESFTHDAYKEAYLEDQDFREVFQQMKSQIHLHNGDITTEQHIQDGLVYKLDKLCS